MPKQDADEIRLISSSGMGRENADRLVHLLHQRPDLFNTLTNLYLAEEEPVYTRQHAGNQTCARN